MAMMTSWACASTATSATTDACVSARSSHSESLNAFVDSAGLAIELNGWEPATGLTLATLNRDSVGGPRAEVYSETIDSLRHESLGEIVRRYAHTVPAERAEVALELGTFAGYAPRRLAALRRCRPEIVNPRLLQQAIWAAAERLDIHQPMTVPVYARVEPDGSIAVPRVNDSSGRAEVDRAAIRILAATRFSPALIEGLRSPAYILLPLRFYPQPTN